MINACIHAYIHAYIQRRHIDISADNPTMYISRHNTWPIRFSSTGSSTRAPKCLTKIAKAEITMLVRPGAPGSLIHIHRLPLKLQALLSVHCRNPKPSTLNSVHCRCPLGVPGALGMAASSGVTGPSEDLGIRV